MPGSRFGAKAEARDRQRHRMADLLSGFYRKYRSLTAHYPIELHEDQVELAKDGRMVPRQPKLW